MKQDFFGTLEQTLLLLFMLSWGCLIKEFSKELRSVHLVFHYLGSVPWNMLIRLLDLHTGIKECFGPCEVSNKVNGLITTSLQTYSDIGCWRFTLKRAETSIDRSWAFWFLLLVARNETDVEAFGSTKKSALNLSWKLKLFWKPRLQ